MTYRVPGLISREIIASDADSVTIREVWDPRVKNCPILIFDQTVWPWKMRTDVESITRTFKKSNVGDGEDAMKE